MALVFEDGIRLRRNLQAREFGRLGREFGDFDSGKVISGPGLVRIGDDAIGDVSHLIPDMSDMRQEAIPLRRHSGIVAVSLADAKQAKGAALYNSRRREKFGRALVHFKWLHKVEIVEGCLDTELLRRQAKELAKGSGEGLMRAVPGLEGEGENVRGAIGEEFGGFAQPPGSRVGRQRLAGSQREGSREMEWRYVGGCRDRLNGEVAA